MRHSSIRPGAESRADPSASGLEIHPASRDKRRGAQYWITPYVLLALVVLLIGTLIVAPRDAQTPISALSQLFSMLFCLGWTILMLVRAERGRTKWAWGFIALAQGLYILGDVVIIVLVNQPDAVPSNVSLADTFFLPMSPLIALGAILFPAVQSTTAKQVRIVLDVSIAVGAVLGLALVFLIIPRVASGTTVDLIFIAYPVTDLTLLLVLIVLLARGVESRYRPVFFWLLIGMVCLIYADTSYNYLSLPGLHSGPSYGAGLAFVDPFWVATAFAFSLAPLSMLRQRKQLGPSWGWLEKLAAPTTFLRPSGPLAQCLLLVTPVLVLFGLILFSEIFTSEGADKVLEVLTLSVVLLIIIRQLLTQRDLVDARIATERAEQLDALKDQFITSVNHELRTPLMTMQGYLELLGDQAAQATPEKRVDMLERARGACTNLVHLVRSILDTRRIEQEVDNFVPEAVNVWEAAQAAMSLMDPREANPAGRHLGMRVPGDLVIWGDPVRVQQILTNLFSNAIKYSPPDAPITITAQVVAEKSPRFLGLGAVNRIPRQTVEILVQDRGLGIPPGQKELLFRRFVRLPREIAGNVHGNGLGLYLCRVFAEAMGGSIWVESSGIPGEGSSFYLRLPLPSEQSFHTAPSPLAANVGK